MLTINATTQFRKDRRRCIKRGYNMALLDAVVDTLAIPAPLPASNKPHPLGGDWKDHDECHILNDWLLIYKVDGDSLMLYRTGTHADLFE